MPESIIKKAGQPVEPFCSTEKTRRSGRPRQPKTARLPVPGVTTDKAIYDIVGEYPGAGNKQPTGSIVLGAELGNDDTAGPLDLHKSGPGRLVVFVRGLIADAILS